MPMLVREPSSWRYPCGLGWEEGLPFGMDFGWSLSSPFLLLCLFWPCLEEVSLSLCLPPARPPAGYSNPLTSRVSKSPCALGVLLVKMPPFLHRKSFHSLRGTGGSLSTGLCLKGTSSLWQPLDWRLSLGWESCSSGISILSTGNFSLNLGTVTKPQSLPQASPFKFRGIMQMRPQGLPGASQSSPRQVCKWDRNSDPGLQI